MSEMDPHPRDYSSTATFKSAWYAEHGAGTWMDDIKLSLAYYEQRDEPVPDHLASIKERLLK